MKIIFCNIAYLRYYDGRIAGELKPNTGGRWVKENEDAHEKWNFLNMDSVCYGYVQGLSDNMHIERFDGVSKSNATAEDVTVIWCALKGNKTVIVGWYEHATAYREFQDCFYTPISGLCRAYWFETKAENAYLLPEEMRTYEIGRASKTGTGTGFGQYNYWFADSESAKKNIIPGVLEFIESHREHRINTQTEEFLDSGDTSPLSDDELDYLKSLSDDQYKEYLKYGYKLFNKQKDADSAYYIAEALENCFQYSYAADWYKKAYELDNELVCALERLPYLYQQCNKLSESIEYSIKLLGILEEDETDIRDELYCIIADNNLWSNNTQEAIKWINKLIDESTNSDLIAYAEDFKANIKENM